MNAGEIADVVAQSFGIERWPSPLSKFTGDKTHLTNLLASVMAQPEIAASLKRTTIILGSLVLGQAAERVFEATYKAALSTTEMRLVDLRERRNDTDYRLLNGQGRPLFRLNIKFHGSLFRNAKAVVGLEPEDCFPLATYKIKSALDKQDQEHLPFIFVIVTGSDISAENTGIQIHPVFVAAAHFGKAVIKGGKRSLEERVVSAFLASEPHRFSEITKSIEQARWYVISARRAELLMTRNLFRRVFALRTRSFNRAYRNAEIDMHLSFAEDMTKLREFLSLMAGEGHVKVAGMLERGTI